MRAFKATTEIRVHSEVSPGRAFPIRVARLSATEMTGTGGMPLGLFTDVRTFRVVPNGVATQHTMREEYSGLLTSLMARSISDIRASFRQFVDGLKAHAEAG